ncbi:UspA domain protein [Desulfofarcimen acetoxidans DSM 771]|jgi:nucleotide-binding universal stress UspA family protein|uniref:Universal stress protein n=1 Tax=Desulfofarcimen acetoxidans (strain ATCC 49208 / DSM 771 / KCTC 5769 / VKM B-1644 / 5575) TaxID=485916 RepID=C8W3A4_DESAS|nr:universal stress protein [Desulfofarcimen acetoxidans]ACV61871.1 UspA domain protein [Desulfofarcimen acetoxidans DSM 771]
MYKKILVPVDGSEQAAKAALQAAEIASAMGAEITLFHVVVPLTVIDTPSDIKELFMRENQQQGQRILEQARKRIDSYNLTVKTETASGHQAHEICKKAKDNNYDLVVIGSRGLGEIKSFLMGSVSKQVVQHADCPVLIVR